MRTVKMLTDPATATMLAAMLIGRSQWFAVTPEPFDKYCVEVKEENAHLLGRLHEMVVGRDGPIPAIVEAQ